MITGGMLINTSATSEIAIIQNNAAADFIVASAIRNPNRSTTAGVATAVIKSGAGTLLLSGNNNFFGTLAIEEGTVKLGSSTRMQSYNTGNTMSVAPVAFANKANTLLDLNGFDATIGSLSGGGFLGTSGITTGGRVNIGIGSLTILQTGSTTFSGVITGSGSISLRSNAQANVLTLDTSASTFSGSLNISNGTVTLSRGTGATFYTVANLANVFSIDINNGGGLNINNSGSLQTNRISDAAPIALFEYRTQRHGGHRRLEYHIRSGGFIG